MVDNMQVKTYKNIKDISKEEYIMPGTSMCAGCGGLLALRLAYKVLGKNVVIVNAAGCFTLLSCYPYTPFKASWIYTAMACAPAGAQGVRDALDVLIEKGRLSKNEDLKVVVLTGDGAAYDIGLQSTSGAIHRNLDFYYFCYDNEAFGNTGFQMSTATPYGSKTGTTLPTGRYPEATEQRKKNLFEIWRAHKPPYLATVSPSHPVDLSQKFQKASEFKGPKLFIVLSPCPPGWGYGASRSARIAKLAVECGIWPLKEAIYGELKHTYIPKFKPVEEYLSLQGRYDHLFKPMKQDRIIRQIQEDINQYWKPYVDTHHHKDFGSSEPTTVSF